MRPPSLDRIDPTITCPTHGKTSRYIYRGREVRCLDCFRGRIPLQPRPPTGALLASELPPDAVKYEPELGHRVYFLISNGAIVYVGKTAQLPTRLVAHQKEKRFDEVYFVKCCGAYDAEITEKKFILDFKPPLNKTW